MLAHNTDRNMTREHSSLCGRVRSHAAQMLLAQELSLAQPHAYTVRPASISAPRVGAAISQSTADCTERASESGRGRWLVCPWRGSRRRVSKAPCPSPQADPAQLYALSSSGGGLVTKQERAHPRTAARPRERVSPIDDGDVVGGGRIVLAPRARPPLRRPAGSAPRQREVAAAFIVYHGVERGAEETGARNAALPVSLQARKFPSPAGVRCISPCKVDCKDGQARSHLQ